MSPLAKRALRIYRAWVAGCQQLRDLHRLTPNAPGAQRPGDDAVIAETHRQDRPGLHPLEHVLAPRRRGPPGGGAPDRSLGGALMALASLLCHRVECDTPGCPSQGPLGTSRVGAITAALGAGFARVAPASRRCGPHGRRLDAVARSRGLHLPRCIAARTPTAADARCP